jgi:hypothetical protein
MNTDTFNSPRPCSRPFQKNTLTARVVRLSCSGKMNGGRWASPRVWDGNTTRSTSRSHIFCCSSKSPSQKNPHDVLSDQVFQTSLELPGQLIESCRTCRCHSGDGYSRENETLLPLSDGLTAFNYRLAALLGQVSPSFHHVIISGCGQSTLIDSDRL